MSEDNLLTLVRDETVNTAVRQAGRIVVPEFLKLVGRTAKNQGLSDSVARGWSSLLASHKNDVVVMLEDYPGLLSVGVDAPSPVARDLGEGMLVIRKDAVPSLFAFRQNRDFDHLIATVTKLKERLVSTNASSAKSLLDVKNIKSAQNSDFVQLLEARLSEQETRIEQRLRPLSSLRFEIDDYGNMRSNLLREAVIAFNKVVELVVEALKRTPSLETDTAERIGRFVGGCLNAAATLASLLDDWLPDETYRVNDITSQLLRVFSTWGPSAIEGSPASA